MECAEIRNSFVAGRVPASPEAEAHFKGCPQCHELFENDARLGRSLAQAVLPEVAPGDLFALVERDVQREVGLRARLRALPTHLRAAALVGVSGALLAFQLVRNRRADFVEYSATTFWGIALALGVALVLGATRLLRGASAPLGAAGRERGRALMLLLTPALIALLTPLGAGPLGEVTSDGAASCFSYGAALVVPLVLLYWLFERRDAVPFSALVSAGALAGIAANLLLHAHCSSTNVPHLLLGHASIGAAWALVLRLVWGSPQPSR